MSKDADTMASAAYREAIYEASRYCGVDYEYYDYAGNLKQVSLATLEKILHTFGIETEDIASVWDSLSKLEDKRWLAVLPEVIVSRDDDDYWVPVHVPDGARVWLELHFENGGYQVLEQVDKWVPPREINGKLLGEATFVIPAGLPLGWHTLVAHVEGYQTTITCPVAISPGRITLPENLNGKAWGITNHFYTSLSKDSWGIGDAEDLAKTCEWAAHQGADFMLINPVHSGQTVLPLEESPYLPFSRRYLNVIYIRPEAILEYGQLSEKEKTYITKLKNKSRLSDSNGRIMFDDEAELSSDFPLYQSETPDQEARNGVGREFYQRPLLDRNRSWWYKIKALETIYRAPMQEERKRQYWEYCEAEGKNLDKFALWCAMTEIQGELQEPGYDLNRNHPDIDAEYLEDRKNFYKWLQWIVRQQFQDAHNRAKAAGMKIGIMHDLAVGVHRYSADVWANPGNYTLDMQVGAPADMYNQLGQNWCQPPWHPKKLVASQYEPVRRVVRAAASLGGALRIDHVMGLFRLWWIPEGNKANDGTYVHYDEAAMVGVLLLEAQRQGIVVIGEDLGTVPSGSREYLEDRGILGTGVLWFEREADGSPKSYSNYRRSQLATVNTHDMPPSMGYINGEDLRIRSALNLLDTPLSEAKQQADDLLACVGEMLIREGFLAEEKLNEEEFIRALHRFIASTNAALVSVNLVDLVSQQESQNQPGTHREYPNWRIPLTNKDGKVVLLEYLFNAQSCLDLLQVMKENFNSKGQD